MVPYELLLATTEVQGLRPASGAIAAVRANMAGIRVAYQVAQFSVRATAVASGWSSTH
jgi:hypothetical protein